MIKGTGHDVEGKASIREHTSASAEVISFPWWPGGHVTGTVPEEKVWTGARGWPFISFSLWGEASDKEAES